MQSHSIVLDGSEVLIQMEDFTQKKRRVLENAARCHPVRVDEKFHKQFQKIQEERQNLKQQNNKTRSEQKKIQRKKQRPQQKITTIPDMKVICFYCTFEQVVQANAQIYACYSCDNLNECSPLYGVFICGGCSTKVCYQLGMSTLIRCTKCKSVNQVPLHAIKKYQSDRQEMIIVQEPRKKEEYPNL